MRRTFAILSTILFVLAFSDTFALASHATRELKCPRCKMKIEKKNGCPCHKKKAATAPSYLHDPCGDDEGDYSIHFDRIVGILSVSAALMITTPDSFSAFNPQLLAPISRDIPSPPPRA